MSIIFFILNQNGLCGQTRFSLILQKSEFSSNLLSPARGAITQESICNFSIIFSTYEYLVKMFLLMKIENRKSKIDENKGYFIVSYQFFSQIHLEKI